MKSRKLPELHEPQIELVPLIDCVFLLIIFFMFSANMSKVDMTPEVALPEARNGKVPEDASGRGTVNILPEGFVAANGVVSKEKPFMVMGNLVDDKELTQAIEARLKEEPKLRLYLRVDKDTEFSLVRRAIAACAAAGVFDIIFGTYPAAVEEKS